MRFFAPLVFLAVVACEKPPPAPLPPLALREGCQPLLAGADCLLPYPSDFFRVPDDAMPSGARVALTRIARPKTVGGVSMDVGEWRSADGASRMAMPTAVLGSAIDPAGLVGYFDDPASSQRVDSPSLLIDAATGERVPHIAELDPRADAPERQALILHPLSPLKARTRYVVVLQKLQTPGGDAVPAPEGFRRLRDAQAHGDPVLEPLAARYEQEIFPVLEKAGVDRAAAQLAWDFTVGSDEWIAADTLRVRELTLAWLAQNTPAVTITQIENAPTSDTWRTVRGMVESPFILAGTEPGAGLHRGGDGRVELNGTVAVPFLAVVPTALRDAPGPAVAVGYGHGSFGSRDEILSAHPRAMASALRAVLFSTDWVGMSKDDVGRVLQNIASEPSRSLAFTERVPQGMANWMVLSAAIAGPLRDQAAFQDEGGVPLFAADASRFIGISQGHILGGVLAAVHPGLRQVVLSSGGAAFSHMLSRSRPLSAFFVLLNVTDPLERRKFEALLQPQFDAIDGAFWGRHVLKEPLPQSDARTVLMQVGLGDIEVPNIGAFIHARALGLSLLQPAPIPVFGLGDVAPPATTSALALYDMGIDLEEVYGSPQPWQAENAVHLGLRALPSAMQQLEAFFGASAMIDQFCEGPCDPE